MRPLPPSASPEGFVGLAQVVQTRGRGVAGLTRRGSPCKSPACAAAPRRLPRERNAVRRSHQRAGPPGQPANPLSRWSIRR